MQYLTRFIFLTGLLLIVQCSAYRLNGIEYPIKNPNTYFNANGWLIEADTARETNIVPDLLLSSYLKIQIKAINKSQKSRKFKYTVKEYTEKNLQYMLSKNSSLRKAYKENPENFDTVDFFEKNGLRITFKSAETGEQQSKSCSPVPSSNGGLFESNRNKDNASDWISPGEELETIVYCPVPRNAENIILEYYGYPVAEFQNEQYSEYVIKSLRME